MKTTFLPSIHLLAFKGFFKSEFMAAIAHFFVFRFKSWLLDELWRLFPCYYSGSERARKTKKKWSRFFIAKAAAVSQLPVCAALEKYLSVRANSQKNETA